MSGFDLGELLPFYLDETDEQIGILNDSLLTLEREPGDAHALQEAFRIVHSLKGSASVMGFEQVNRLAHHLETLFDQLRSGERTLDPKALEIGFRCLDQLRDYHRQLRDEGRGQVDLGDSIEAVLAYLDLSKPAEEQERAPEAEPEAEPEPAEEAPEEPAPSRPPTVAAGPPVVPVTVTFDPRLQWRDMKARLILNRLSSRAKVVGSDPAADHLEEVESRPSFTVWIEAEIEPAEARSLAEVEGVVDVRVGEPAPAAPAAAPRPAPRPADGEGAAAAVIGGSRRRAKVAETLRVDVERLDHLMNLAGELVISRARFAELTGGLDHLLRTSEARRLATATQDRLAGLVKGVEALPPTVGPGVLDRWRHQLEELQEDLGGLLGALEDLGHGRERMAAMAEAVDQLGRVCDGIQRGVLDTRMVPIGPLFERFRRVVRDLCVGSGKEVVLEVRGAETELDKRMIDELSDPLIHMVRNAVDHGLELPEAREAAGKPRTGTVTLAAAHRGNRVVITLRDDGRGIDSERLRRKVVEADLATQAEASRMAPSELIPFIFHPGLSTAETVTEISGRGVGMDIVKGRIENLNGTVDVRTEPGRGTTFTIHLPLTLAIMPSLLARIHDEVYAVPLSDVKEIVEVGPAEVLDVQGERAIEVRGRIIALIALDDVFRWGGGPHPSAGSNFVPDGDGRTKCPVVVLQDERTTIGLAVDELLGMQEVVLKSIEANFREVRGLSGASILGDGRVALILDVDAVIDLAIRRRPPAEIGGRP